MNFDDAVKQACANATQHKIRMAVVAEGPHADEHAERPSFGFCPAQAVSTLYMHGTVLVTVNEDGTTRNEFTLAQLGEMRNWIHAGGHNGGKFGTVSRTLAIVEEKFDGGLKAFLGTFKFEEPEPVNSLDVLSQAVTNAARIAYELGADPKHFNISPEVLEEIEDAATALARVECAAGFGEWGEKRTDWESMCVVLATLIAEADPAAKYDAAGWETMINAHLG